MVWGAPTTVSKYARMSPLSGIYISKGVRAKIDRGQIVQVMRREEGKGAGERR